MLQEIKHKLKTLKQYIIHVKNSTLKLTGNIDAPDNIIKNNIKLKQFKKMYNGYHVRYKYMFLKPILTFVIYITAKFNKRVLGKSFIPPEKMDNEQYNKIYKIWNTSVIQTCAESNLILKQNLKGYYNPISNYWTKMIKLCSDIMLQTAKYDTMFGAMFEMFAMNLTINMNKEFHDKKDHVLYNKKVLNDIDFLLVQGRNDNHLVLNIEGGFMVVKANDAVRVLNCNIKKIEKELKDSKDQ